MISHKFIDVLRGAIKEPRLELFGGSTFKKAREFAELINDAEKFDFGALALEPSDTPNFWIIPELTQDEQEAYNEGLIVLPAPLCWFEFSIDGKVSGVLIREDWTCTRIDWPEGDEPLVFDDSTSRIEQHNTDKFHMHIVLEAPREVIENPKFREGLTNMPLLIVYLALMIGSRTTELTEFVPPPRLNRARAKRGRTELASHRVVRIVPEKYLRARRAESGMTRLPPRLHYRRSHIRTLQSGRRILIPRFLVGRKSEAEVSHEYRIVK